MLLWAAGIAFFVFVLCVILIWQSINWLKNAPEPTVATYPALIVSPGEEEDVTRVITSIEQAKQQGTLYEDYITPGVFNAVMAKILDGEQRQGKKDAPLFFRGALVDSDKFEVKVTAPTHEGQPSNSTTPQYINAEVTFQMEIVDGEFRQASVNKLVLRHRDAPFISRMVVNWFVNVMKTKSQQNKSSKENELGAIKLLKRDGERLHFILDGKVMRQQDLKKEAAPKPEDDKAKPAPSPEKPAAF